MVGWLGRNFSNKHSFRVPYGEAEFLSDFDRLWGSRFLIFCP
jgi:hypothetical protein